MQPIDITTQAVSILAPVVSGGASLAQGVATKVLGEMISQRLCRHQEGAQAWNGFRANPQNDSLVRYLLQLELERDTSFRLQIEEALQKAITEPTVAAVQQAMSRSGSGNVQVGGSAGRIATNGGSITDNNVQNTTNHKKSSGGGIGVIAMVLVIVLALVIFGAVKIVGDLLHSKNGGLTANSTCQQFLNANENDERQALADIGISEGFSVYSSPLALPEIQYECGGVPSMTLGALIKRDGDNG